MQFIDIDCDSVATVCCNLCQDLIICTDFAFPDETQVWWTIYVVHLRPSNWGGVDEKGDYDVGRPGRKICEYRDSELEG